VLVYVVGSSWGDCDTGSKRSTCSNTPHEIGVRNFDNVVGANSISDRDLPSEGDETELDYLISCSRVDGSISTPKDILNLVQVLVRVNTVESPILVSGPTSLVEGENDEGRARSGVAAIDVGVIFGSCVLEHHANNRHAFLLGAFEGV